VNIEKEGIPTVCLITTAFRTIAEAQQKALGYPGLPFVMLEHPVAVATGGEIEAKVEAVYAELVRKLTGGPARPDEANGAKTKVSHEGPKSGTFGDLEKAISPIRAMLQADGADLAIASKENGTVYLRLIFTENVCEECILPRDELGRMILANCRESDRSVSEVVLQDPREAT
jgi:hypothetical protein